MSLEDTSEIAPNTSSNPKTLFPIIDPSRHQWYPSNGTDRDAEFDIMHHNSTPDYQVKRGWVYPPWVNWTTGLLLSAFPVGIAFAFLGFKVFGIALVGLAFLGIWIVGNAATRVKKPAGGRKRVA